MDTTASTPTTTKRASRKVRGTGSIYQRGEIWWIRYWHRGECNRESTGSTVRTDAVNLLRKRLEECGKGRRINPTDEARVTMASLFDMLLLDYKNNGRRSFPTLRWRLDPLRAAFGRDRAIDVTEARIEAYKGDRLEAEKAPATVNRELAALRRAFRLAVRRKMLTAAPYVELLAERNAREGFLEPADFEAVAVGLPDYLEDAARFAYLSGWRKGEVQTLEWSDVDRGAGRITLRREHSKNGEPRVLPLSPELAALIERRWSAREYRAPDGSSGISRLVFHRAGRPLGDFRKAWRTACNRAGLAGTVLFHDLRRSAVRNLDRAGVGQAVAMKISGHKTISVWKRYRIVNEDDMRAALTKTETTLTGTPRTVVPLRAAAAQRA